MATSQVKFSYIGQAKFKALGTKDEGTLYFIKETGEVYKGVESFSKAGELVTDFPASPALGKLYFNTSTLEGKIHNGTDWTTVIQAAATTIDAENTTQPVSGKAVADYVKTNVLDTKYIKNVTYDESIHGLKVTDDDGTTDVQFTGLLKAGATYVDGTLTLPVANGQDIVLNLPKENFVKSGSYDEASESIVLVLQQPDDEGNEQKVVIPVSKLVDISSVTGSDTLKLEMSPDKVISGEVKISTVEGNLITAKSDGIYVAPVDLSGKLDVVDGAKAGEVLTVAADGQVAESGVKIGGASLVTTPDSSTLATEAAVKDTVDTAKAEVTTALNDGLALKVDKASISTSVGTAATASDEKVVSEKAVATVKETIEQTITTKTTELQNAIDAVSTNLGDNYVAKTSISTAIGTPTASDDTKVASEKAVATVKDTLEKADAALLEAVTNVNDAKVDKANISTVIPDSDAVDTKVASEKAVADVKTALNTTITDGLALKVDKANISTAIPADGASDEKVASEKAVADAKADILSQMTSALAWEVDL